MLNVIIPMAGEGSRFAKAGYTKPKPFIDIKGKPLLYRVIESLACLHKSINLTLLCRADVYTEYYSAINYFCSKQKYLSDYNIEIVSSERKGAGGHIKEAIQTYGLDHPEYPLLIKNVDDFVLDYQWLSNAIRFWNDNKADAGICIMFGSNPNWGYCKIENGKITYVAEKSPISNFATFGVYYYARGTDLLENIDRCLYDKTLVNGEVYIGPTFNYSIADGKTVLPYFVNRVVQINSPEELEFFNKNRSHELI